MSDKKFDIRLVSLEDITIRNATLENHSGKTSVDLSRLEIAFQYELNASISIRSKKVQITAEYDIRVADANSEKLEISSRYSIVFLYTVENLAELAIPDERKGLSVDDEMLSNLLNITYSTSRGILYTRYLGTLLQGLILPIIATTELFESPSAVKSISTKS